MPPKKKRGGQNQVTFVITKMSTRSTKRIAVNTEKKKTTTSKPAPAPKAVVKTAKKPKAVSRIRAKKSATKKKKNEVKTTESPESPNNDKDEIEAMLSEFEREDDENQKTEPIEQVFLEMDDTFMESSEIENIESETCDIVEQLESLNVQEDIYTIQDESSEQEDTNATTGEESDSCIVENLEEQVIEIDSSCEDFPVEYITEEFVPVAETTEIIIDEESGSNIILEKNVTEEKEELLVNEEEVRQEENKIELKDDRLCGELPESNNVDEISHTGNKDGDGEEQQQEDADSINKAEETVVKSETKSKKKPVKKETKKNPPKKKPKPKPQPQLKKEINDKTEEVRRSSRIKSINVLKQRSKGHGLVKSSKNCTAEVTDTTNFSAIDSDKSSDSTPIPNVNEADNKPVKVKSRWRRSSELEMNVLTPAAVVMDTCGDSDKIAEANASLEEKLQKSPPVEEDDEVEKRLKQFVHLKENLYLTDRMTCKEAKKMTCDCFLTAEDIDKGEWGCGEDCLNRLLMIECGNLCPVGDRCTNKKFQKTQFAPVEVFKTEKKGLGLRAAANIPYGEFILEYVGEVLDHDEFDSRADDYSNDKNKHYYFMALRADAIIDATRKGNISRFINHSCDPNAETQKWTVNGELRIGFFSTRTILAGEEITFDYRFQRYGKEAQKCYCEAATCRGWLGEEPDEEDDDEEEEDEEEEEEEEVEEHEEKPEPVATTKEVVEGKLQETEEKTEVEVIETKEEEIVHKSPEKEKKRKSPRKKPQKAIFEDLDQLDEEIEMLVTTGLKNQAHTLKLSRLMVRAKEPTQRAKLLRVLRRGELPCRRLFLDYHGLRLMHGYMTDAEDLVKNDEKFESLRLELLQTLAVLPIPNKTMLQDSKVLPTVEKWSIIKRCDLDSDVSSPQTDQDPSQTPPDEDKKEEKKDDIVQCESKVELMEAKEEGVEIRKSAGMDYQGEGQSESFSNTHGKALADEISNIFQEDMDTSPSPIEVKPTKTSAEIKTDEINYEEEIIALALKLLEEWSSLKEVFKIPKKERIEQMKEHEREANRGYIAGLGAEQDTKNENRYRILKRYRSLDKNDGSLMRKSIKLEDRNMHNFPKLGKFERRKMFALQVEQREEERRRKQREMWRQHEQQCILLGTDPRLTAPFDPSRGYQCIWNPQIGQWQNYPIQNPNLIFTPQNPPVLQGINMQANTTNFSYMQSSLPPPSMLTSTVNQPMNPPMNSIHPLPSLPYQEEAKKEDYSQVKFMGPIPPPVKLPPKWKCAKDKYGRPYYYHIKIRKSQWEPPPLPQVQEELEDTSETTSSSDTSSFSSDTSSEESDSDEDIDDSKLIFEVRKQMEKQVKISFPKTVTSTVKNEDSENNTPEDIEVKEQKSEVDKSVVEEESKETAVSIDARLKDMLKEEKMQASSKKRRVGLVHEIIISPRSEEDRLQFKEDLKRYKMNKEKLKKEKEMILQQSKKHSKDKRHKTIIKLKMKEMNDANSETAKKIKEAFRSSMATVVVSVLNAYRKPDCKEGRITNTDDFKHLARKLTHFVMLKEMKHIEKIEELVCTDNVKAKAREYIRKYMSKFGENYQKRNDEPDF